MAIRTNGKLRRAYFATNVRKKREAESGVYLTPPILLGFIWSGLVCLGFVWTDFALRLCRRRRARLGLSRREASSAGANGALV